MARLITQSPLDTRLASWLETAWLQRYLERRLDAEETAWFEAYVVDKPALLERLERDTDLRDGLAEATRDKRVAAASQPTDSEPDVQPLRGARRRRPYGPGLALAASLLAGIGVGWISARQATPADTAALIANPMRIVFDTERGAATGPRIEHAGSASPYTLVEIAVPPGAGSVTVQMENGGRLDLVPSAEGFVYFLARKDARTAGRVMTLAYVLDGSGQTRSFTLDDAKGEAKQ